MSEFVYLYRSPPTLELSLRQMQERMGRWSAWFKDLEEKGHLANLGNPLQHSGGGVVKDKKGSVSDGPYTETKDIVIGYTIVEAKDFEQAATLAAQCPIFDQGGVVEVRPIMKM